MSVEAVESRIAQIQSTLGTLSARPAWTDSRVGAAGPGTTAAAGSGALAGGVLGDTGDFSVVLDQALGQGAGATPAVGGSGAPGTAVGTGVGSTTGFGSTTGLGSAAGTTGIGSAAGTTGVTGTGAPSGTAGAGSGGTPSGSTGFGERIVQSARKHLGVRYVWGGNTPAQGFDCSGLVKYVMRDLGVSMPRVARDQATMGTEVASLAQARPGDLLGMRNGTHIAIYLGDNKILHAPRPGENVSIRSLYSWDDIDTIRRVAPAGSSTGSSSASGSTRVAFEQLAGASS